jgi:DNA mismatch repair protein MSH6
MGKKNESGDVTPARTPALKKQNSSAGLSSGQRTIASFFTKAPANGTPTSANGVLKANDASANSAMAKPSGPVKKPAFKKTTVKSITPVPSSDAMGPSSSQENENGGIPEEVRENGLPSPSTPAKRVVEQDVKGNVFGSSPSRKVFTAL